MASNNVKTGIFPLFTNDSQGFLASLRVVGMNVDQHKPAAKKNTTATKDEAGEPHRQLRIICRRKRHPKERNIYVWSFDTYYKFFLVLSNFIPRPSIIRHLNSSLNFILVLLLFTPLICLLLFYEKKNPYYFSTLTLRFFFFKHSWYKNSYSYPKIWNILLCVSSCIWFSRYPGIYWTWTDEVQTIISFEFYVQWHPNIIFSRENISSSIGTGSTSDKHWWESRP